MKSLSRMLPLDCTPLTGYFRKDSFLKPSRLDLVKTRPEESMPLERNLLAYKWATALATWGIWCLNGPNHYVGRHGRVSGGFTRPPWMERESESSPGFFPVLECSRGDREGYTDPTGEVYTENNPAYRDKHALLTVPHSRSPGYLPDYDR